MLKDWYSLQN